MNSIGPLHIIPKERRVALTTKEERREARRYDPETSVYNSKTEHDLCNAILRWNVR